MQKSETIHPADNPSSISTRGQSAGESAIAQCCLISARMLELADTDGHSDLQRLGFRNLNGRQAELLREAARQADEMLAALKEAKYFFEDDFPDGVDGPCAVTPRYREAYRALHAAILKATGA